MVVFLNYLDDVQANSTILWHYNISKELNLKLLSSYFWKFNIIVIECTCCTFSFTYSFWAKVLTEILVICMDSVYSVQFSDWLKRISF